MPKPRGRLWLTLWLLFVLAILAWVVARQTSAVVDAGHLDSLRVERSVLEARRLELIERVREAESREVLESKARALGLRELRRGTQTVAQPADPQPCATEQQGRQGTGWGSRELDANLPQHPVHGGLSAFHVPTAKQLFCGQSLKLQSMLAGGQ